MAISLLIFLSCQLLHQESRAFQIQHNRPHRPYLIGRKVRAEESNDDEMTSSSPTDPTSSWEERYNQMIRQVGSNEESPIEVSTDSLAVSKLEASSGVNEREDIDNRRRAVLRINYKYSLYEEKIEEILSGKSELVQGSVNRFMSLPKMLQNVIGKHVRSKIMRNDGSSDKKDLAPEQIVHHLICHQVRMLSNPRTCNEVDNFSDFYLSRVETQELVEFFSALQTESRYYRNIIPDEIQPTENNPLPEESDVLYFCNNIISRSGYVLDFERCNEVVKYTPNGFMIYGSNNYNTGNELLSVLDEKVNETYLQGKFQLHYIEATEYVDETLSETERLSLEPVLFITGATIIEKPNRFQNFILTSLGFGSIYLFNSILYASNQNVINQAALAESMGDLSGSTMFEFASEISIPLLFILLVHDIGHRISSAINNVKLSIPTLMPFPFFATFGTTTRIRSAPKSFKALFDIALSGPLLGLAVSFLALFGGLSMTKYGSEASMLPLFQVEYIQQSFLLSKVIETALQITIPNFAVDATYKIPLHPLAIAGAIGVYVNALNLLPMGRSDGGRIFTALFGRQITGSLNWVMPLTFFMFSLICPAATTLRFYSIFCALALDQIEMLCRNEVDDKPIKDPIRIVSSLLVYTLSFVTIFPFYTIFN